MLSRKFGKALLNCFFLITPPNDWFCYVWIENGGSYGYTSNISLISVIINIMTKCENRMIVFERILRSVKDAVWFLLQLLAYFNIISKLRKIGNSKYYNAVHFSCDRVTVKSKSPISKNNSTGASDRSFYPIFNKKFDHLKTLLTICRPKNVLSAESLCRPLVSSPQSKCPKRTFMLRRKYHAPVSNMLLKPLKCFV